MVPCAKILGRIAYRVQKPGSPSQTSPSFGRKDKFLRPLLDTGRYSSMASGQQYQVTLPGPAPWGFRLSGGKDFSSPLSISRVTPGGRASMANIAPGDVVLRIGQRASETLTHIEAQNIIKTNDGQLELTLVRGDGRIRPMPATPAGPSAPTIQAQPARFQPASVPASDTTPSAGLYNPTPTTGLYNPTPTLATSSVNKLYNSTPKPFIPGGGASSVAPVPTGSANGVSSIGSGDNSAFAPVQQASAPTQAPPLRIQRPTVYKPPPVQAPSVPSPPLRAGQPFSLTRISPVQSGTSVQTGPSHLKVSSVSSPVTRISPMAPTRLSSLSATGQPPSVGAPRSPTSPGMVHSQYNTPINMYAVENVSETLKGQQLLQEAQNRAHLEEVLHLEQLQCSLRLLHQLQHLPLTLQLHLYLLLQCPGAIKRAGEAGLGKPAAPIEIEAGGRKIVHAQYDTPLGMYSAGAVQDTLEGQLAGLVGGKPEVTAPQRPADQPASGKPGTEDSSDDALLKFTGLLCRHLLNPHSKPGTIDTSSAVYQMIQEESARKARMQPRVAPPPEPPTKPGASHAQSRSFRLLQMMTAEDEAEIDEQEAEREREREELERLRYQEAVEQEAVASRQMDRLDLAEAQAALSQKERAGPRELQAVTAKEMEKAVNVPTCQGCDGDISGPMLKVKDKLFHASCFNCAECGTNLRNSTYILMEGNYYCEKDAIARAKPPPGYDVIVMDPGQKPGAKTGYYYIKAPSAPTTTVAPSGGGGGPGRSVEQRRRVVRGDRQDRKAKPIVYAKMGVAGSRTPICEKTKQIIRGPFVVAMGRCWQPDQFVCFHCNCNLIDRGFVEEENELYCSTHYKEFFAPLCGKCGEPICETSRKLHGSNVHVTVQSESIIANDMQFCKTCFLCAKCNCQLDPNGYHLWEGAQICDICFAKTMSTKCTACDFPIEPGDRWLEALNVAWHTECFCCAVCQVELEGAAFYAKGKKPYCKIHAKQAA
ncbi:LDB3 [Branchiostoma lanceolatum]|uniref:LDB3 protein n=1 Tax=Branchiostoma lanceolatum TaxID=7740 RepID=A0A8K0EBJ8_BRALA|nr:LDB3 [Branchiostoma lanceolatum]